VYDVAIIGAGVSGAALAARLGHLGMQVALVERDWRPPQLFVGELLQPGGLAALEGMGLAHCVEGIDAQPTRGFGVTYNGETHSLVYPARKLPGGREQETLGYAFHHPRFVERLRQTAEASANVEVKHGTVGSLVSEGGRVRGLTYRDKTGTERTVRARLVVAADGRNSRLRRNLGKQEPERVSYSVGVLLRDVELPCPGCGNVIVAQPSPMLAYRIGSRDVRILVDVPGKLPGTRNGELATHLRAVVAPQLPEHLRGAFLLAIEKGRLRAMPNYALAPKPERVPGAVMLGDALNMRHPVTGSGMTVALGDARLLSDLLRDTELGDPDAIDASVTRFYKERKPLSSVLDMLAGALYDVFRADGPGLERMREAMIRYWKLGGRAAAGPMALLSGLAPRPSMLLWHYTAVALLGVSSNLVPASQTSPRRTPDLRGASQLAAAALSTIRPQLRRALL
jgi:squalene monooxygenase